MIQSVQNVPLYTSLTSGFPSKMEREADTRIMAFDREIFFAIYSCVGLD